MFDEVLYFYRYFNPLNSSRVLVGKMRCNILHVTTPGTFTCIAAGNMCFDKPLFQFDLLVFLIITLISISTHVYYCCSRWSTTTVLRVSWLRSRRPDKPPRRVPGNPRPPHRPLATAMGNKNSAAQVRSTNGDQKSSETCCFVWYYQLHGLDPQVGVWTTGLGIQFQASNTWFMVAMQTFRSKKYIYEHIFAK